MSVRDVLRSAAQIGPRALGYRALWEASNRSGLRQLTEPAGAVPVPPDLPSFEEWSREWPADHLLRGFRERSRDATLWSPDEELVARARRATRGELVLFGHHAIDAGRPPNFLSEPISGAGWPPVHWSRVMEEHVGDPRTTWELNRFGWVWDWIRALPRDPDGGYGKAFAGQLLAWEQQNPFRVGINWVSGQELALRVLAWTAGAAVLAETDGFEAADFRRFWKLVYWHGYQIEAQLDFARLVVPNNHLLAESLMLAIIADLAGSARSASAWRERGLAVFRAALPAQFREDGGYCQNSHRYHRFALELVLLADRWFPELRDATEPVLEAGFAFFRTMVVAPGSGTVPNFGPNDGATAFRLTSCADGDVRPLLATLATRLQEPPGCGPGGWDEQSVWLYGTAARPKKEVAQPTSRSFPESGLHVLRSDQPAVGVARRRACRWQGWTAYLRCGATSSRGGHADQLHVDVWRDGEPVAIDAGSARYFDPAHYWHVRTAAHNTVTVDGRDQQKLAGRFTWLDDAPCHLAQFDAKRGRAIGRTEAFLMLGILHERELIVGDDVKVIDLLTPVEPVPEPHLFRLHWLLPESIHDVHVDERAECFTWNISTPRAEIVIEVQPVVAQRLDASLDIVYERQAPAYGALEDAAGVVVDARGYGVKFVTSFREPR